MRAAAFPGVVMLAMAGVAMAAAMGCRGAANSSASGSETQTYSIRGVVEAVNPAGGSVVLKHEAVVGLMPAMTMEYKVIDPAALQELHVGDMIAATLLADKSPDGPTNLRLKDVDIVGQAKPDYAPKVQYHVPAAGDEVPDFKLVNQSDRTISLGQFRGQVLVMTFIYTRCPLADYCVRMSHNFARMDKDLKADPKLYAQTHLLSVSFDPAYDTPKVLRSYGEAYTGEYTKATFAHWDFAAPAESELSRMEQYFDIGVTPGAGGTLQHSLSTLVIGKDGRVTAFYPSNDWTPAEVEAQVRKAAAA